MFGFTGCPFLTTFVRHFLRKFLSFRCAPPPTTRHTKAAPEGCVSWKQRTFEVPGREVLRKGISSGGWREEEKRKKGRAKCGELPATYYKSVFCKLPMSPGHGHGKPLKLQPAPCRSTVFSARRSSNFVLHFVRYTPSADKEALAMLQSTPPCHTRKTKLSTFLGGVVEVGSEVRDDNCRYDG